MLTLKRLAALATSIALLLACTDLTPPVAAPSPARSLAATDWTMASTIAFSSTRDNPTLVPLNEAEIYLLDSDFTNARRLTESLDGDGFAALRPDGKSIVFDSNRLRLSGDRRTCPICS